MERSSRQEDEGRGQNPDGTASADTPRIETNIPDRSIVYASVVAFIAWVFGAYDYTLFGTLLPEMARDLGWSTQTSTAVTTWVSIGVFIIAMTVGPLLDYLGRKTTLIVAAIGAGLSSALTALSFSAVYVVIVRAFSGFGYSEQAVNGTYLNELYGNRRRRGFMYSFVQAGWPVGVLVGAGISVLLLPYIGWRGAFLVAALPAIIIVILGIKLRESPRFLAMKRVKQLDQEGKQEEAEAFAQEYGVEDVRRSRGATLRQIFEPEIRKHTIFLSLAFLCQWIGNQVFIILGTTVLTAGKEVSFVNSLLFLVVANAAGFVGYLVHGYVGDIIGRRRTIIGGWIISGITFAIMLLGPNETIFVLTLYTIGLFFMIGPFSALLFYMGESFPARMRGTGASFVNATGPIGAITGAGLLTAFQAAGFDVALSALFAGAIATVLSGLLMFGTRKVAQTPE